MSTQDTPETPAIETPIVVVDGAKPDEPLGAPGLAALKSERDARAAAEQSAKEALAKVKEYEDAKKTDQEKQAEALANAKKELAELTVAKTRAEVAAAKGVPASLLTGSTQEELEKAADALLAFKGEAQPQKLHIPGEGNSPSGKGNPSAEFADFLASQLGQ